MGDLNVDPDRFLADLRELRQIGRVKTGVVRPAFSSADIEARNWLVGKIQQAGLSAIVSATGNVFGIPETTDKPILMGSHTDSQLEGGWLDGSLGVIAGLEIARASVEEGSCRVAVVSFQDEEGRFGALTGSNIWTGGLSPEEGDELCDVNATRFGDARRAITPLLAGIEPAPANFSSFVETHIEQGPNLDEAGEAAGIVTSIVGSRQVAITFDGEQNHAGTTPMSRRRDAVRGFYRFAGELDDKFAEIVTKETVWTIGQVQVEPNAPSIVPGQVKFTVQWRDASNDRLERMRQIVDDHAQSTGKLLDLRVTLSEQFITLPRTMDTDIIEQLSAAAETIVPGAWRQMTSGALHDAAHVASCIPTGMLFAPSIGGLSHCFEEDTNPEHLVACLNVLAEFVRRLPS